MTLLPLSSHAADQRHSWITTGRPLPAPVSLGACARVCRVARLCPPLKNNKKKRGQPKTMIFALLLLIGCPGGNGSGGVGDVDEGEAERKTCDVRLARR